MYNGNGKCFVCDKKLGRNPPRVITEDGQVPYVGAGCLKDVIAAGKDGLRTRGGPKVFTLKEYATANGVEFNFNKFPRNGLSH
jgi:hypothetical protein